MKNLRSGSTILIRNLIVTWLECETMMASGKKMVRALKCSVCNKYKIRNLRVLETLVINGLSVLNCFALAIFETTEKTTSMSLLVKEHVYMCVY